MAPFNLYSGYAWRFKMTQQRSFLKKLWEKEKMMVTSIFPFPTMFSTLHKTNFKFSVTFIFQSAYAFNLDWSKILLFGKDLKTNFKCSVIIILLSA